MSFSGRPSHVFGKPCLIALRRISVVGLKIAACKYWDSSGFEVFSIMLSTTFSGLLVSVSFDYLFSILLDGHFLFI